VARLPKIPERLKQVAFGLINSRDHASEVNLAAYGLGVLTLCACLVVWTLKGPRDAALVAAFGVVMTGITTGLWKKGSNGPQAKEPGTQNDEGGKS